MFAPRTLPVRILAVLLTAALVGPAFAKETAAKKKKPVSPGGSTLSARVIGYDGKPIANATVVVTSLDDNSAWASKPSDKKGRISIPGIRYGWAQLTVKTPSGDFLGDQAMNFPPGKPVEVVFNLIDAEDRPASWWADRQVEVPPGSAPDQVFGMAQSTQKLTGVEYWKSPKGIAIVAGLGAVALLAIAAGGHKGPGTGSRGY